MYIDVPCVGFSGDGGHTRTRSHTLVHVYMHTYIHIYIYIHRYIYFAHGQNELIFVHVILIHKNVFIWSNGSVWQKKMRSEISVLVVPMYSIYICI